MKKRKFSIWLNVVTICLSICAIAIGVYSIKTASLNINGAIGFTAHNCNVDIVASMYGDSAESDSSTALSIASGVVRSEANAKTFDKINVNGGTETLELGTLYFCDMTDNGNISSITFNFTITNKSTFYIDLAVNQKCINNNRIFIYAPNNGETLAPKDQDGSSITLLVEFQLQRDTSSEYSSLDTAINLSNATLLNFEKSQAPAYLATDWQNLVSTAFDINYDSSTGEGNAIKIISFLRQLETNTLSGFVTNSNGTYKSVSVGAINETSKAGNLTSAVSDIFAYYNATTQEVVVYSPARIYAPEKCGSSIFYSMTTAMNTTTINLTNFDTSKVTYMASMFESLFQLTSLDVSNLDTSNVTDMNMMFCFLNNLSSLDVRNFNTSKVTNMYELFGYGLYESLDLSNFDTSNVTNMVAMFSDCSKLNTIYVNSSKWSTTQVTSSDGMFSRCTNLPNYNADEIEVYKAHTSFGGYLTEK